MHTQHNLQLFDSVSLVGKPSSYERDQTRGELRGQIRGEESRDQIRVVNGAELGTEEASRAKD
jgi:hypothetical protein